MRSRRAATVLGVIVLAASSGFAAYVWLFVVDRVVLPADTSAAMPDGSRAEWVGLRSYPPLTPWAPHSELRIREPDGSLRWTLAVAPHLADVEVAIAGDDLLLVRGASELHAVELAAGNVLWSRDVPSSALGSIRAVALGGRVFVSGGDGVHALDRASGAALWSRRLSDVDRLAPFGDREITAGRFVLDAETGAQRPPLTGFSCRTEGSLLTCGEHGCVRRRAGGSESVLTERALDGYVSCFESGGMLLAMIERRGPVGSPRDSVALASLDEIGAGDRSVLVAWDAHDRLRWARVVDTFEEPCLLLDGRLKVTVPRPSEGVGRLVVHTRYYDPATGEHEHCVGIDDCPGVISEPWGLAPPGPAERACVATRAVGQE
jgi:hypothetical protein